LKTYSVIVTFPEAPAAHAEQRVTITAMDFAVATYRAVKLARKLPQLKGKHLERMTTSAVVIADEAGKIESATPNTRSRRKKPAAEKTETSAHAGQQVGL
jgi:hypothetical protein